MTTQNQIIAICIIVFIAVPFNKKYFFEMLNRLIILIFILLVYITFFLIEDNTLLAVLPLNIIKLRKVIEGK
jgi:hypothetical protein